MSDEALPLSLFDYSLPADRIAHAPARPRDRSRLMVLPRAAGVGAEHRRFCELPGLLRAGDLLVVNRTRVMAARLQLRRSTGARVELLPYRPLDGTVQQARTWEALGRPGSALRPGRVLHGPDGMSIEVEQRVGDVVRVRAAAPLWSLLEAHGQVPLPPYVQRDSGVTHADFADYQTIFARELGAVAAPTASLHFTEAVLEGLRARGVGMAEILLHVGPGTFLPVRGEHAADVRHHAMHEEWYEVPPSAVCAMASAHEVGGRVVAVGTTSVRALETWARTGECRGASSLFIYPGFEFRTVDAMITNFHLPRSTLLMLVAAFCGRQRILDAYAEAVTEHYRFYSYGDAMLLW